MQSVPKLHHELAALAPPSSQTPLLEDMQVSRQISIALALAFAIISAAVAMATNRWRAIVSWMKRCGPGGAEDNRPRERRSRGDAHVLR